MSTKSEQVRIQFELDPDAWHGVATERLWATPLAAGRYRLENSPFYAFGVSWEDEVFAQERRGQLCFTGISVRGGHSTYRLILEADRRESFEDFWQPLQALGCTYEEGNSIYSVDIPPGTNIFEAYPLLEAGEADGVWDFEEAHCGHPVPGR